MSKHSSMRANKNPPHRKPVAEEPATQKKPYVFARAFARFLGVDEEQAVAGYLASTSPGEPHPTIPETVATSANVPSDSSFGRPITQTGGKNRKVTEIPNPPNMKLPPVGEIPARVTKFVPTQGEGNRAANLPHAKESWESNPVWPISQTGGETRKLAEIPDSLNMKFPPVGEIEARITKSVPTEGESNRATRLPQTNVPSESSQGRPSPTGGESRKVTEFPNLPNSKFPPVREIQARVMKSPPLQREGDRATSAKAPWQSSPGRPNPTGGESRKVTEIPNSLSMKSAPLGEIKVPVAKPVPAQGESNRTTSLPQAKVPSESIPEHPITPAEGENRKVTEIRNSPNMKSPPVAEIEAPVAKSVPALGESNRTTSFPQVKVAPESSPGQPITQTGGKNREVVEISNPSIMKLPSIEEIRAWVTKSASIRGRSDRPINLSWETFSILVLVVTLGVAVWSFYRTDTRVHAVPPNSNSSASISPPAAVTSSKATKALPSFEVRIQAHKNVRVLIKADGRKVTEETLTGGAERSVRAANQIIIKSGNLGALDLEFNGRRLPSQGAYGEVKTLEFGPSGLEVIISNPPTRIKPGE